MPRTVLLAAIALTICHNLLAAEPATQPTSTSAPAKITIDQSSPKELLLTIHQATEVNDYDAFVRCTDPAMRIK